MHHDQQPSDRYRCMIPGRVERAALLVLLAALWSSSLAQETTDPLASPVWDSIRQQYLEGQAVVFDERVQVLAPGRAEDSMNVPVKVDASLLDGVEEVLVLTDLNPIVKVLEFRPRASAAVLSFRIKVEQATPVRALARTRDGTWHAGGTWVEAAGGGCTAPSTGRDAGDWWSTLGEVNARLWGREVSDRLRFSVRHPMDTGLAPGIPAFHLTELNVHDREGRVLMGITTYEPVAENPVFTVDFLPGQAPAVPLELRGVDTNGNRVAVQVGP